MRIILFFILIAVFNINCNSRKQIIPFSVNFCEYKDYFGTKKMDSVTLFECRNSGGGCGTRINASLYMALDQFSDTIRIFDFCKDENYKINTKYRFVRDSIDCSLIPMYVLIPMPAFKNELIKYPIYFGRLE